MKRTRHLIAGAVAALVLLTGCGAGSDSASDTAVSHAEPPSGYADSSGRADAVAESSSAADAEAGGGQAGFDGAARGAVDAQVREVITTAEVTIVVADPSASAGEVVQLADDAGGRVDQRSVRTEERATSEEAPLPSAWLRVRVPAGELDSFLGDLDGVGEVLEVTQSSEDVTQTAHDLDARIEALETSTERLLEIMADSSDSADLIAAEEALSQRQAELESLQSQRNFLADQVAMSTVTVNLRADYAPTIEPSGFLGGLQAGWHALIAFVAGLLAFAGMLVPWLPVIALPVALIFWVRHRRRRTRAATTAFGAPAATPPARAAAPPAAPGHRPHDSSQPPNTHGQPPSTQGEPPNTHGQPPSTQGEPPNTHGQPPSTQGEPPNTDG